jgi:hypothetical protein
MRQCANQQVYQAGREHDTLGGARDQKLANCTYFLQSDGANAYWSIPVCDKSKRLTAFHTPDGIFCWNRLLMGARPSSAVQQSANLEALDDYIDYYADSNQERPSLTTHLQDIPCCEWGTCWRPFVACPPSLSCSYGK